MDKISTYISKTPIWAQQHLNVLRLLMLDAGLQETIKWGAPVYVHKGNVLGLIALKNYVSVWFYQGVFLVDDAKVLVAAGDKTKAQRQWRFAPGDAMDFELMMQYVQEAIYNDEQGLKILPQKAKLQPVPIILTEALAHQPMLKAMFEKCSTSRRNEYSAYVAEAKREETKQNRVQKVLELLVKGEGLNDKYKK